MKNKLKQCQLCGDYFSPSGNHQKRCKVCQEHYRRIYQHNYNINHRDQRSQYMKQYYSDEDNHEKHLARVAANNSIYTGKKSKDNKCAVKGCKCTDNLQKHHILYGDAIENLATVTLCRKHHRAYHAAKRKQQKIKKRV